MRYYPFIALPLLACTESTLYKPLPRTPTKTMPTSPPLIIQTPILTLEQKYQLWIEENGCALSTSMIQCLQSSGFYEGNLNTASGSYSLTIKSDLKIIAFGEETKREDNTTDYFLHDQNADGLVDFFEETTVSPNGKMESSGNVGSLAILTLTQDSSSPNIQLKIQQRNLEYQCKFKRGIENFLPQKSHRCTGL